MVLFFYAFAALMCLSALGVVFCKSPVRSALCLMTTFLFSSGIFILMGAEFIAMSMLVVYVGAVAVMFLFMVMTVDLGKGVPADAPHVVGASILVCFLGYVLYYKLSSGLVHINETIDLMVPTDISNTQSIARVAYSKFAIEFQMCGLIFLMAMIACLAIAVRHMRKRRHQDIVEQLERNPKEAITMVSPELGVGMQNIKYD